MGSLLCAMTIFRRFRTVWLLSCFLVGFVTFHLLRRGQELEAQSQFEVQGRPLDDIPDSTPIPGKLAKANISQFVWSILDPEDTGLPRLSCPRPDLTRYQYLKPPTTPGSSQIQYFFALNLKECLPLLPRLLGSIVDAIRFLGPEHCALSIVEGNSPDGTAEVLAALQPELARLMPDGRTQFVLSNTINPLEQGESRFGRLADLRNLALRPLVDNPARYAPNATVIFVNDVAICLEDILELVHQRHALEANMTCAMDWIYGGADEPIFYDSYIARTVRGDLFFDIPPETASYDRAAGLFWNEPVARTRFEAHRPFQVYSCWNGAVAFAAQPVAQPVARGEVAFRPTREGECHQGEPELFCKDLWARGHGRIAVVPSVNLAYDDDAGRKIKLDKGYTSQWTGGSEDAGGIEWRPPPGKVKCMPSFTDQTWRSWNETLI